MIKDDGTVINFKNPKVQAAIGANTFCIAGNAELKTIGEMMPGILQQLGQENLAALQKAAQTMGAGGLSFFLSISTISHLL